MRKLIRLLPIIALLAAPLQVLGGTQTSMQVSFTVLASCTVDGHGAAAPAVECGNSSGFIVTPLTAVTPAASVLAGNSTSGWTVYF